MNAYADIEEFVLVVESAGQVSLVIDKNRRTDVRIQRWVMDQTRLFPYAKPEFVSLGDLKARRETFRLTQTALRVSAAFDSDWSDVQKRMVRYFALAQLLGSSDIHITIMRSIGLARIEMRIHGELEVIDELTSDEGDSLVQTLFRSMCDIRIPPAFNDSDMQAGRVDAKFVRAAGLFGARYQHMTTADGIYVVLRTIVDDSDRVPTLEQQGFLPEQIALAKHILRFPNGLVQIGRAHV